MREAEKLLCSIGAAHLELTAESPIPCHPDARSAEDLPCLNRRSAFQAETWKPVAGPGSGPAVVSRPAGVNGLRFSRSGTQKFGVRTVWDGAYPSGGR